MSAPPPLSPVSPSLLHLTRDDGALARAFGPRGEGLYFLSVRPIGDPLVLEVFVKGAISQSSLSRPCFCGVLGSPNLFWSKEDRDPPVPAGVSTVDVIGDLFTGRPIPLKRGPRAIAPNRFFLAIAGGKISGLSVWVRVSPSGPDRLVPSWGPRADSR